MLRVRGSFFWRIELTQDTLDQRRLVGELKSVLATVLQYETMPCPFKRSFHIELPESSPSIKRPWKPRQSSNAEARGEHAADVQCLSPQPSQTSSRRRPQDSTISPSVATRKNDQLDSTSIAISPLNGAGPAGVEHRIEEYEDLAASNRPVRVQSGLFSSIENDELPRSTLVSKIPVAGGKGLMDEPPDGVPQGQTDAARQARSEPNSLSDGVTPTLLPMAQPNDKTALDATSSAALPGPLHLGRALVGDSKQSNSQSTSSDVTCVPSPPRATTVSDLSSKRLTSKTLPSRSEKIRSTPSDTPEPEAVSYPSSLESFHSLKSSPPISAGSPRLSFHRGRRRSLESTPSSGGEIDRTGFYECDDASSASSVGSALRDVLVDSRDDRLGEQSRLSSEESTTSPSQDRRLPATLRRRFRNRRQQSPFPRAANLYLPSSQGRGSYLTSHVLQKTCNLLLGPPVQVVALMLNLAARIAGGALQGGVFTYDARGEPVPYPWDVSDDDDNDAATATSAWQDDFGVSLVGRGSEATRMRAGPAPDTEVD